VLADRPVTVAEVTSAITVAPEVQAPPTVPYSTVKPVSPIEASVHVTRTDVEPRASTVTPAGAAGGETPTSTAVTDTVTARVALQNGGVALSATTTLKA